MTTHTTVPQRSSYELTSDNRIAVETMLDFIALPAPTIVPRAEAVFVTVTDVDDLGVWLTARGGRIHVTRACDGLELWTLVTRTPRRKDGTSVEIRVSVPVVAREVVLASILAAVVNP